MHKVYIIAISFLRLFTELVIVDHFENSVNPLNLTESSLSVEQLEP